MGNPAMGNLSVSSGPDASIASANPAAPTRLVTAVSARGELARQRPSDAGYILQQFVRLAGAQCRMSAEEVAYHNRTHEQRKAS